MLAYRDELKECPVCKIIEQKDEELGQKEYEIVQLEGTLAEAQNKLDELRGQP